MEENNLNNNVNKDNNLNTVDNTTNDQNNVVNNDLSAFQNPTVVNNFNIKNNDEGTPVEGAPIEMPAPGTPDVVPAENLSPVVEPVQTNSVQELVQVAPVQEEAPVVQQPVVNDQTQKKSLVDIIRKNKIPFIIVGAIVLVLILVLVGKNFFGKSNEDKMLEALFNEDAPIQIKQDGKYGFIDTDGKIIIQPEFSYASDFYGNYAIVGNSEDAYKKDDAFKIIDKKGNVKMTSSSVSRIEYIPEYSVWVIDSHLYNSNLSLITNEDVKVEYEDYGYLSWINDKAKSAGIMTTFGEVTYTYKFNNDETYLSIKVSDNDLSLKSRYCIINVENEKNAVVNCDSGKVVVDFTDKYITDEDDNIFEINDKDTFDTEKVIYIQNDKIALEMNGDDIEFRYNSNGYITIYDESKDYGEKYSYYDLATGKTSTDEPSGSSSSYSSYISEFEEFSKLKKFSCDEGYGIKNGEEIVVPCGWNSIDFFDVYLYKYLVSKDKNYFIGYKDDKTYIYDINKKKVVIELNTKYVSSYSSSVLISYKDKETNKTIILNLLTLKSESFDSSLDVDVETNYFTVTENGKKNYYNLSFKKIYTEG
ncbi:MAG: WG repeat-containing protein [Bacilli bacterium]|nr:WG repeat-containing protein [Bacilli bacterium]